MTEKLVGIGAGGHAKVVIEILRFDGRHEIVGLLDRRQELHGTLVADVPVLGNDGELSALRDRGTSGFFIGVGTSSDLRSRRRLYELAVSERLKPVSAIHPAATISDRAKIGQGFTAMAMSVISVDAHLGNNVIINTGAIVEHDCIIGDHCHVASGAVVAGGVRIGEGSHIGAQPHWGRVCD